MKKKIIIIAIAILCLGCAIFTFTRVKADSGWDSSYDSDWGSSDWGSSDWGSSDWDSDWGSSWDYDYDYDGSSYSHSSSSSHYSNDELYLTMVFSSIMIIMIINFIRLIEAKNNPTPAPTHAYSDVSDELLTRYGINKEEFKQMVYQKYVDIQNAWMNFDYNKLKDNLTDELYNSYQMELAVLHVKKQKNIMSNFEKVDAKIINITEENDMINVKTYLRVWMHDYVVDENNNVLRGSDKYKIDIEYIIDWVREKTPAKITKCPHCGAKINAITSGTCEYCRAKIVLPAKDYVMSRKMSIGQRRK